MKSRTTSIPEKKVSAVKELIELFKNKRTLLIASVKNLPTSQFQEISKKLRGKAVVKVVKKNLILRALDESKNEDVKKIKPHVQDSTALLFSDLDSFELAAELVERKSPAKAKIGQEAPKDIEVEAGPTDLVPGPAISELGALGIQIQIDKGKIAIKENKIIVKRGQKISEAAVGIMNKLDIKPFMIGITPIVAFDIGEGKLYESINIDREGTLLKLKEMHSRALAFAVNIEHYSSDTIKLILQKAGRQGLGFQKILPQSPEVKTSESPTASEV